ncbi:MAG: ABC transporter permease [Clostridia bacterium]|nr:ABC transporter permease [Clostridia bacterium]
MIKLLRANFTRLVKSATFWIFFSAYILYSILTPIIIRFVPYTPISESSAEILAFGYGLIGLPIPAATVAVICSVIFGADFQNGTLKNKIIISYRKSQIYAANLLTTSIISIALIIVYQLFFCILTLPLFGKITVPAKNIYLLISEGALMVLAYSSIFTFITMTSKNQIAALLISLSLIIVSYFLAIFVFDAVLSIPPYIYVDAELFGIPYYKKVPNPELPGKSTLDFCKFMLDFLPTGQDLQITLNYDFRWQPMLYNLGWICATNGAGMLIFNKTNLK